MKRIVRSLHAMGLLSLVWLFSPGCDGSRRTTVDESDAGGLAIHDAGPDAGGERDGAGVGDGHAADTTSLDAVSVDGPADDLGADLTADLPPLGDIASPDSVVQLAAGDSNSCALLSNGMIRCWGHGGAGQLGYGNTETIGDDETPASAGDVDVGGVATQIAVGRGHACAVLAGGQVRCWGSNLDGELGYANTTWIGDDETPATAGSVGVGGPVRQVAAGLGFTCALLASGKVRCWGRASYGALGYGDKQRIGDDEHPAVAGDVDVGGVVTQIAAGSGHVCALLVGGKVRCWGDNMFGALGYGHTEIIGDDETPAGAGDVDVGGAVTQIAAGGGHTCALLAGGKVRCWGSNTYGQLGHGDTKDIGDDEAPAAAGDVDLGGVAVQIAAGGVRSCAVLAGGKVRCWGGAWGGALGYQSCEPAGPEFDGFRCNQIGDDEPPAAAGDVDVGAAAAQVVAGDHHTCALLTSGAVRCWGWSGSGQLGYGNTETIGDDEPPASAGDVPVF